MTAFSRPIPWGPATVAYWTSTNNIAGGAFDSGFGMLDADNSIAMVFIIPKDGTIDTIGCFVQTFTGNPPAYYFGLVTVDAGTGVPSTTGYGGSAVETYDFTGTGWVWVTLATPATAVAGALAAVRLWPTASAPDASNMVRINDDVIIASANPYFAYYSNAWNFDNLVPGLAARYSTGEIVGLPAVSLMWGIVDSGTTPDEVGCKFTIPTNMKCIGARVHFRTIAANGAFTVKLYDNANNLLASDGPFDEDVRGGNVTSKFEVFWDEVTLTAGESYRLTILPADTTDTYPAGLDFESAASKTAFLPDGANWQATSRTDAGAWTDDASGVTWMSLLISDITFATTGTGGAYGFAG